MDNRELVADQLLRARAFHSFVRPIFSTESIEEGSYRMLLYCGLCANVLEHYSAILTLLENGQNFVGAFALLRPLMDTTLQTLWMRWRNKESGIELTRAPILPPAVECAAAIKGFLAARSPGPFALLGTDLRGLSGVIDPDVESQQRAFNARVFSKLTCRPEALRSFFRQASESVAIAAISRVNCGVDAFGVPDPAVVKIATKYRELFGGDSYLEGPD